MVTLLSMLLIGWVAMAPLPAATEPQLPPDLQLALLTKVLSFDRRADFGSELVIAVPFQPAYPASVRNRDGWLRAAQAAAPDQVAGARVRVIAVPYTPGLADELRRQDADVAVLGPLRAVDVPVVAERVRSVGVRTAATVAEYGSQSTAVQLLLRDGRGHIVINHGLARREGAEFSSQLLRVAEVVP
jgi:hypothetical protein